jgi:hypothetical protein
MDERTYKLLRPLLHRLHAQARTANVRTIVQNIVDIYIEEDELSELAAVMPYVVRYIEEFPEPLYCDRKMDSADEIDDCGAGGDDESPERTAWRQLIRPGTAGAPCMLVPWTPPGISAPIELLAAKVPAGSVTEREWVERLADRVTEMAQKEPPEMTTWACRVLGLPETDEPGAAGEYLVMGNWNLQAHLNRATYQDPFPATAKPSEAAARAIAETDLERWVDLAAATVSPSSLD